MPNLPKQSRLQWTYAVIAIMTLLLLSAILTYIHLATKDSRDIQSEWVRYDTAIVQKGVLLERMRDVIGYGGFIHNFKNFIIRGTPFYYDRAIKHIVELDQVLAEYRERDLTDKESDLIDIIEATFKEYAAKFEIAKAEVAKSTNVTKIDTLVAVDDTQALKALKNLTEMSLVQSMEQRNATDSALEDKIYNLQLGYLLIPLVILAAVVFLFLMHRQNLANIELETAKKKEEEARDEAETANRAKSDFLSSMSHELRTPMNAILGFTQMLQYNPKEPLTEAQKSSVDCILRGGNHLLELINQVLELAKIETGHMSLSVDNTPAREIIDNSLSLIRTRADRDGIEIVDRTAESELPLLWTDNTRLTQVLLNLLSNAVKYNRENGTVTLTCQERPDRMLRISVADTGRGIPLDKQNDLFKPFNRLGLESGSIEGTGIGLTITKQIIELLGGHIGFESEMGKGSTFWIDVPISENQDASGATLKMAASTGKVIKKLDGEGAQYSVLYVEDNPDNMRLMEAMINRIGNTKLLTAYNAELGLDLAKSEKPDLILMDINLPGMNGIEALKQLQNMAETKDIPVIAITAAAMSKDAEAGLKAGFSNYITKPINVPEFIQTIQKTLNSIEKSA